MASQLPAGIGARSYYGSVVRRAALETRRLVLTRMVWAVLLLVVAYGFGVLTGAALNAATATKLVIYPLAMILVVALLFLTWELVHAPLRLARDTGVEFDRITAERDAALSSTGLLLHVGGVVLGEADDGAVLQPTVSVTNPGASGLGVYGWQATLEYAGETHELRHLFGQQPLHGSLDLPFLDRIGPLHPGQTTGLLQFLAPDLRQLDVVSAFNSPDGGPMTLLLRLSGPHGQAWETSADLRALSQEALREFPSGPP